MGDRELIIDSLEALTGARVTHAITIPGGVRNDMPYKFKEKAESKSLFRKQVRRI